MKQQGKEITRGELLVCWLGFFDIKARISPRKKKKIFLIGLPKTGTTSAHYSLHRHGYKAEHFPYQLVNYNNGTLIFNRKDLKRHDAVSDLPVAASVEQIAKLYPDAYFINTVRNKDSWLDSCRRHPWPIELVQYGNIQNYIRKRSPGNSIYSIITDNLEKIRLLHERVLGTSVFNLDIFAQSYDRYQNKVRDLFAEKIILSLI